MKKHWYRISTARATFGLAVRDGVVIDAAPYSRWAMGKPLDKVLAYWRRRGAMVEDLGQPEEQERQS